MDLEGELMNADSANDEYTYTMPAGLQALLIVISLVWFSFNHVPVIPLGFIISLVVIAGRYETTRIASLRKGWPMVWKCGLMCLCALLMHHFG